MNTLESGMAFLITLGLLEMVFWIITFRSISKVVKWLGSERDEENNKHREI